MPPYQQRVVDEYEALESRTLALYGFFNNPLFENLGTRDQELLLLQYEYMKQYSNILSQRIARFS